MIKADIMRRLLNFPLSLFFLSVGFMFPLSTNANVIKKSYAKNKLEQHKLELCKAIKFSLGEKNFVEFKEYENLSSVRLKYGVFWDSIK